MTCDLCICVRLSPYDSTCFFVHNYDVHVTVPVPVHWPVPVPVPVTKKKSFDL